MIKVKTALESSNLNENQSLEDFLDMLEIVHDLYCQALGVSERGKTVEKYQRPLCQ